MYYAVGLMHNSNPDFYEYCNDLQSHLYDLLMNDEITVYTGNDGISNAEHTHYQIDGSDVEISADMFYGSWSDFVETLVHESRHHFGEEHDAAQPFESGSICTEQL